MSEASPEYGDLVAMHSADGAAGAQPRPQHT